MEFSGSESPQLLIRRAPSFASARIFAGGVDLALISLVPAMVARTSVAEPILALALVSAMALGTMLLQYPIAILADDYGLRKVSIIAATSVFLFFSLIPFFLDAIIITTLVALFGAGLVYGLYSIAHSMLYRLFKSGETAVANAGLIIIFEAANLLGPMIAGAFLDINFRLGLPTFIISMGVFYLTISWVRCHANLRE